MFEREEKVAVTLIQKHHIHSKAHKWECNIVRAALL